MPVATLRSPHELHRLKAAFARRLGLGPEAGAHAVARDRVSDILGYGYGPKVRDGTVVSEDALQVYVRAKLPERRLPRGERVPEEFEGLPTDVVVTGEVRAAARPAEGGASAAHFRVTAGTLGCLLEMGDADRYALSCNHVFAHLNAGSVGDDVLEPSPAHGGTVPIAALEDFEPIRFAAHGRDYSRPNRMDAAIAKLNDTGDVLPTLTSGKTIGAATVTAFGGLKVSKHGQRTHWTDGKVRSPSADIMITMPGGKLAWFEDQVLLEPDVAGTVFAQDGDSGALVVTTAGLDPVALLIAVSSVAPFAWATPIDYLLTRFAATIVR